MIVSRNIHDADYVIDNSGKTLVTPQVIGLDKIFRAS